MKYVYEAVVNDANGDWYQGVPPLTFDTLELAKEYLERRMNLTSAAAGEEDGDPAPWEVCVDGVWLLIDRVEPFYSADDALRFAYELISVGGA